MKRRLLLTVCALGLSLVLALNGSLALAQSYDPEQDLPKPTLLEKRLNKLGRGFGNLLWGWTEIPVTWHNKMKEGKPFTYLFSAAPVLGTAKAVMRTGIGVYEIFTFPTTKPEVNYEPLIEPEYIF